MALTLLVEFGKGGFSDASRLSWTSIKLLDGHFDNGGSHEQTADRLKVTKALLGSEFRQSATSERSNDHAERTNRRQTESLGRISHGQIVSQQQWNRLLTTNEK